jgi:hypothetical protein
MLGAQYDAIVAFFEKLKRLVDLIEEAIKEQVKNSSNSSVIPSSDPNRKKHVGRLEAPLPGPQPEALGGQEDLSIPERRAAANPLASVLKLCLRLSILAGIWRKRAVSASPVSAVSGDPFGLVGSSGLGSGDWLSVARHLSAINGDAHAGLASDGGIGCQA